MLAGLPCAAAAATQEDSGPGSRRIARHDAIVVLWRSPGPDVPSLDFPFPSTPACKEVPMAKGRRTTHRSASGKKLYAVRDAKGRFKDIQTYERAHRADLKRKSKKER